MKKVSFIFVSVILVLETTLAFAGNTPSSVPGKTENPKCQTSSNASTTAKIAVTKSTLKACQPGDGLSEGTAGSSAWQIKRDYFDSPSGNYWIKNSAINRGKPFQIYADMTTEGGGWTLIVANSINSWNSSEALLNNQNLPPTDPTNLSSQGGKYSILSYADNIKKSSSGFQYRMDARELGKCGGIWTSNSNYSFTSGSTSNTDITLNTRWGFGDVTWLYNEHGIEQRMPYLVAPGNYALLTTSIDPNNSWWGTIIQSTNWENSVTPWISFLGWGDQSYLPPNLEPCARPSIIWYWVR
jgi:hypothetical protein